MSALFYNALKKKLVLAPTLAHGSEWVKDEKEAWCAFAIISRKLSFDCATF